MKTGLRIVVGRGTIEYKGIRGFSAEAVEETAYGEEKQLERTAMCI